MPKGYSGTQIALHWIVALLVLFQFLFNGPMGAAFDAAMEGNGTAVTPGVVAHVAAGAAILVFALWRLSIRLRRGVPAEPPGTSALQARAAHWIHIALYALMILLPIGGSVAWFGGVEMAGEGHAAMTSVLLVLVGLHVLAALYHQFIRKDHLLLRMMKPDA